MTMIGVSEWMFLLVLAHMGCPGQNPESRKMVVVVVLVRWIWSDALLCFMVYSED